MGKNPRAMYLQEEYVAVIKKFSQIGTPWETEKQEIVDILNQISIPFGATLLITDWEHIWAFGEDVWYLKEGMVNVEIEWSMDWCIGVHKKDLISLLELKTKAGIT